MKLPNKFTESPQCLIDLLYKVFTNPIDHLHIILLIILCKVHIRITIKSIDLL